MDNYNKAKAIRDKLVAEKEETAAVAETNKTVALNQLAEIEQNSNLAKLYKDNANVGTENLGGVSPLLKVHTVGKSSTNELADGTAPHDGWFFYKPSAEEFETLDIHIMAISKGFKVPSLEKPEELKFNQIIGGVIKESSKPFLIYLSGKRLSPMWDLGKLLSKYTHAKPFPIPMFALTIRLSTHSEKSSNPIYGSSWIIDFDIVRNEDKSPLLVSDEGEFTFLRSLVGDVQDMIEVVVAKKVGENELTTELVEEEDDKPEFLRDTEPADIPFNSR